MQAYTLQKASSSSLNWQDVPFLNIDTFPWYESGAKQNTQVQLAYDEHALFIRVVAEDKHSFAQQTKLNHMLICEDSCVEFFFSPSGVLGSDYINLEVNCCGTLHIAKGQNRHSRQFLPLALSALIERDTTIKSPVKIETSKDISWGVEITLPFKVIEEFTGESVNLDKWYANFYRCGGRKEPQFAVWNNIDVSEPDYHRPESFGELNFN